MKIQETILQSVSSQLSPNQSLSTALSDLLSISQSTAYKKINGSIRLSVDEISLLSEKYKLPLYTVVDNEGMASFQIDGMKHNILKPLDYFIQMRQHLRELSKYKDLRFIYFSRELPIFHFLHFPNLLVFKLFIWNLTNWKGKSKELFSMRSFLDNYGEFNQLRSDILRQYLNYAGTEIWSLNLFDVLMNQIKFAIESVIFESKNDVVELVNELQAMHNYLVECCENGIKRSIKDNLSESSQINIYHNQIIDSTTLIYAKNKELSFVYSMYDSPNFINSNDPKATNHIESWLDNVIKFSKKISKEETLNRKQFLNQIQKKLTITVKNINTLIDLYY